jgi:hypothetical protein
MAQAGGESRLSCRNNLSVNEESNILQKKKKERNLQQCLLRDVCL